MMRLARIVIVAVLTLASITLTTEIVSAAQTARQRYEAAIKKAALPVGSFASSGKLSKALCVCSDKDVGAVEMFDFGGVVGAQCTVYFFNLDGSVNSAVSCADWALLTK